MSHIIAGVTCLSGKGSQCTAAVNRFVFDEGVLRSSGEGGASQDQGDESKRSCSDQNHNGKGDFLGHREKRLSSQSIASEHLTQNILTYQTMVDSTMPCKVDRRKKTKEAKAAMGEEAMSR